MDSYMGFIYLSAFNFNPRDFMLCQGQLIAISQNQALYSLLGTNFGGDGRVSFGIPDMRGRVPIGAGNGPGLSFYQLGQRGGQESVNLSVSEMPSHNHYAQTSGKTGVPSNVSGQVSITPACNNGNGTSNIPTGNFPAVIPNVGKSAVSAYATTSNDKMQTYRAPISGSMTFDLPSDPVQVDNTGGGLAHENRMPFTVLNYVICTNGLYPPRN